MQMDETALFIKRLQEIAINEDGFAFDPRTGESYRLNTSAQFIFKCIRSGMDVRGASDKLSTEYRIPAQVAYEDVQDFLLQLKLQGLK